LGRGEGWWCSDAITMVMLHRKVNVAGVHNAAGRAIGTRYCQYNSANVRAADTGGGVRYTDQLPQDEYPVNYLQGLPLLWQLAIESHQ